MLSVVCIVWKSCKTNDFKRGVHCSGLGSYRRNINDCIFFGYNEMATASPNTITFKQDHLGFIFWTSWTRSHLFRNVPVQVGSMHFSGIVVFQNINYWIKFAWQYVQMILCWRLYQLGIIYCICSVISGGYVHTLVVVTEIRLRVPCLQWCYKRSFCTHVFYGSVTLHRLLKSNLYWL